MTEYTDKIAFNDVPIKIDQNKFIEKLNARIGEIKRRTWDVWYGLTLKYKEAFDTPNASQHYKTPEGFHLGIWQSKQRDRYSKGKLFSDRIKRLEDIGFKWNILEERFEKGFQETLLYKERTGNPNAPKSYKTPEGFCLGNWQSAKRKNHKNGNLSPERVKRLETIGFTWERFEERFEKGFQETLLYKESNQGDPNAPQRYKTAEGFSLGKWQHNQRQYYKNEILSSKRTKRFSDIGFKWVIQQKQFEKGFRET